MKTDVKTENFLSGVCCHQLNWSKAIIEAEGFRVISLEENALLRTQISKDELYDSSISMPNFVKEGFVYVPKEGAFLVRNSPSLKYAEEVISAYLKIGYPGRGGSCISNEKVEEALADSIKIPQDNIWIPTNKLGDDELTVFAFGSMAKKYGEFLESSGIEEMGLLGVKLGIKESNECGALSEQAVFCGFDRDYTYGKWKYPGGYPGYTRIISKRIIEPGNRYGDPEYKARWIVESSKVLNWENMPKCWESTYEQYSSQEITHILKQMNLEGLEERVFEALKRKRKNLRNVPTKDNFLEFLSSEHPLREAGGELPKAWKDQDYFGYGDIENVIDIIFSRKAIEDIKKELFKKLGKLGEERMKRAIMKYR